MEIKILKALHLISLLTISKTRFMKIKMILVCMFFLQTMFAQSTEKLKLFLDCNQQWLCDMDFLRKEFTAVDFVRDRFLSDVQVISNVQFTNGGGESNTIRFIGQKAFEGQLDTITYFNEATATEDAKRKKMLKTLQLGLMPMLLDKGNMDDIDITFKVKESNTETKQKDPFDLWQFTISSSGIFNGDRNYSSSDFNSSFSASRETDKTKFYLELYNNINRRKITIYGLNIENPEVVRIKNDRQQGFTRYNVKLNEHWAVAASGEYSRSVFDNIKGALAFTPSVEYSIFPYAKFNDTRLVVSYGIGPSHFRYQDTTIYEKLKETLVSQKLRVTASFTKPWGSINMGTTWSNYMDDFDKNNFSLGGAVSWNIFKGFKFSVGGSYELIHDQISLPKQGASRDDLLTQRRLIATSYNFFGGVGFSYTFGSIYNSQVNPTFRGLSYGLSF